METKKNKLGQLGVRYGRSIKERIRKVASKVSKKHICPSCKFPKVRRVDASIFECQKCNHKFAGGAYYPETMTGAQINKVVTQKENMLKLSVQELEKYNKEMEENKRKAKEDAAEVAPEAEEKPKEKKVRKKKETKEE